MKLKITKTIESDIPALVDILTQATEYKLKHGDMAWGEEVYTKKEVSHMLSKGGLYSVRFDNKIIATFTLQWEDKRIWGDQLDDAGYLHQLAVQNNYHGMGVGEQMIEWAAKLASKKGKEYLRLDCDLDNSKLCGYYKKQGFKQVGTISLYPKQITALYEKKVTDHKNMKIPSVLYHASKTMNLIQLEPREERSRFSDEGPVIFATPDKAVAAMFLAPNNGGPMEISKFGNQAVLVIKNEVNNFIKKDVGGTLYTLPSETFTTDPAIGMRETEWVSKVPVTPLNKEVYNTSLEAMAKLGVKVYFVNDEMYKSIKSSNDHGWAILSNLESYKYS